MLVFPLVHIVHGARRRPWVHNICRIAPAYLDFTRQLIKLAQIVHQDRLSQIQGQRTASIALLASLLIREDHLCAQAALHLHHQK